MALKSHYMVGRFDIRGSFAKRDLVDRTHLKCMFELNRTNGKLEESFCKTIDSHRLGIADRKRHFPKISKPEIRRRP